MSTMSNNPVYHRFDIHQRVQHIGMFVSFFILTITGLPIKFQESNLSNGVVSLFGGFDNMFAVHLFGASIMLVVSIYHLLYLILRLFTSKRRSWAVLPSGKDVKDVIHDVMYLLGFRKDRPLFERYSYKEKFDYWAVFWGMAIIGGSGLMMWFPQFFTQFIPRWVIDSARYAHSDEAILAIAVIFTWHFYNVHFNPKFFPMSSVWYLGTLTREEMEDEHPLELKRLEGDKVESDQYKKIS